MANIPAQPVRVVQSMDQTARISNDGLLIVLDVDTESRSIIYE